MAFSTGECMRMKTECIIPVITILTDFDCFLGVTDTYVRSIEALGRFLVRYLEWVFARA